MLCALLFWHADARCGRSTGVLCHAPQSTVLAPQMLSAVGSAELILMFPVCPALQQQVVAYPTARPAQLPKLLELVGLGYTVWFTYRYLLFKVRGPAFAAQMHLATPPACPGSWCTPAALLLDDLLATSLCRQRGVSRRQSS